MLLFALATCIIAVGAHIYYLSTLAATEKYPSDTYLATATNKVALIITAHDDDAIGSAGTIAQLCADGWTIRDRCFFEEAGLYAAKNAAKNPLRKEALRTVAALQGLAGVDPVDFNYRHDSMTEKAYMPMPYEKFAANYDLDSLSGYIASYIEQYKPSVIFTLDEVMGGYGNPDHVVISQLVLKYCLLHRGDPGFPVERIYQPVFPPSLSKNIFKGNPTYAAAMEVYQCEGMPMPDVEVKITAQASLK